MHKRTLFLALGSVMAAVAFFGPGAGSAQAVCMSIGAPGEVDFNNVYLNEQKVRQVFVINACGENVKVKGTAFNGNPPISLKNDSCSAKTVVTMGVCSVEFEFKPPKAEAYTASMQLTYEGVGGKVPEEKYTFQLKGSGIKKAVWNPFGALSGSGSMAVVVGALEVGCGVSFEGETWGEGEGNGSITSFSTEACETNLAGCSVKGSTSEGLPWQLLGYNEAEGEPVLEAGIGDLKINAEMGSGCSVYGIPSKLLIAGMITGPYNNSTSCIEFSEAKGLTVAGVPATTSGEDCVTEPEGLELE
jgi:hypothetical protein